MGVLNLIINGIPSILSSFEVDSEPEISSFKPYYKWNTFNTNITSNCSLETAKVLNLIINGIPSILI